jgi:hypothetical protein
LSGLDCFGFLPGAFTGVEAPLRSICACMPRPGISVMTPPPDSRTSLDARAYDAMNRLLRCSDESSGVGPLKCRELRKVKLGASLSKIH